MRTSCSGCLTSVAACAKFFTPSSCSQGPGACDSMWPENTSSSPESGPYCMGVHLSASPGWREKVLRHKHLASPLHQARPCVEEGEVANSGQETVRITPFGGGDDMSCGKRVAAPGQSSKLRRSSCMKEGRERRSWAR